MNDLSKKITTDDSTLETLRQRFIRAAFDIYKLGKSIGLNAIPTDNPRLPNFTRLPYETQEKIVEKLEISADIYKDVVAEGKKLTDAAAVVWMAFKKFNLVPTHDFFDKVSSDDVIQVYSAENVHQFANLRFFELCTYTIEQVYSCPWDTLWVRDMNLMAELFQVVGQAMQPEVRHTLKVEQPPHHVVEIASPFRLELKYRLKYIAPIFDRTTREKAGYVVIESGEVLNDFPKPEEQENLLKAFYGSEYSPLHIVEKT